MNYVKYDIRTITPGAKELREMVNRCSRISGIKQEEPTMKVSYNGFTGELVKLEVTTNIKGTLQINGADYSKEVFERKYNLEIYDSEKKVTHSFTNVNLKDVKFLGCSVSFE